MEEEIIYRYKNGHIIPIKVKKDLTTNDYMNNKIKGKINKTLYHTSNNDFNEFDNNKPRQAILGGQYGYGHYFFDDKEISDGYGAYNTYQYEAKANVNNWFKSTEKTFDNDMRNMGYNYVTDDIAKFLESKGYDGTIIEHTAPNGKIWNEYVIYDAKNIKIINKKKQN